MTQVAFSIESVGDSAGYSYFALEDIKVTVCETDIRISETDIDVEIFGCAGDDLMLTASYDDAAAPASVALQTQWQRSTNGGAN